MGLVTYREGKGLEPAKEKPNMCWRCHQRKEGLFGVDPNGNPICADCARKIGRPVD